MLAGLRDALLPAPNGSGILKARGLAPSSPLRHRGLEAVGKVRRGLVRNAVSSSREARWRHGRVWVGLELLVRLHVIDKAQRWDLGGQDDVACRVDGSRTVYRN